MAEEAEGLTDRIEELYTEATTLADTANATAHELGLFMHEQAHARPYTSLAVAAGIGFLLAGGLTPKVGRTLVRTGAKVAASRLLREVLRAPA